MVMIELAELYHDLANADWQATGSIPRLRLHFESTRVRIEQAVRTTATENKESCADSTMSQATPLEEDLPKTTEVTPPVVDIPAIKSPPMAFSPLSPLRMSQWSGNSAGQSLPSVMTSNGGPPPLVL